MTTEKTPAPALKDALSKEETALLWSLLNTQGTGAPFAAAHIAAGLFAKTRDAAIAHGLVSP